MAMARLFGLSTRLKAWTLLLLILAAPSEALACRLALVLAIDVSKSVDSAEFDLQFQGLADALRDRSVRTAILSQGGPVAMAAFHWSGQERHAMVADWLLLTASDKIDRFAERIERHARKDFGGNTSIGSALTFARELLDRGPECARQVIDVSGDGYHNDGRLPLDVYEDIDFSDTTVNALAVGGLSRPQLAWHFETQVIRGRGAFVIATQSFDDYADAIRLKLIRELNPYDVIASMDER